MADEIVPRRGDVWLVAFDPSIGGEIRKTRPAIVLSNDTANALLNRVQLVPVSSQMADQITTASKLRLQRRLGSLDQRDVDAVARAVSLQLGL